MADGQREVDHDLAQIFGLHKNPLLRGVNFRRLEDLDPYGSGGDGELFGSALAKPFKRASKYLLVIRLSSLLQRSGGACLV